MTYRSVHSGRPPLPPLQQLIEEDAVGQLRRGEGRMAALGSEDGIPRLDWVEGVARLLDDKTALEEVEAEARAIWERGIRHMLWAGMGGSVLTIHVLRDLGFCGGCNGERIAVYPLDSTDPAALNAIIREIAATKHMLLPTTGEMPSSEWLHALLNDVMMVGVSMGMTSEEPITHLTWFADLIEQARLRLADHLLVMTLPGSYLDGFAQERQVPSLPLQLDGRTGTGGRMSAPTTRVFLLPAALYLTRLSSASGQLRSVLQDAWREYNLLGAIEHPAEHPFVQLAATLSEASINDVCRLMLRMPGNWKFIVPWIEQLMEESLGKGGKGIIVFEEQPLHLQAPYYRTGGTLHVYNSIDTVQPKDDKVFILAQPHLANEEPRRCLAALAASFLGWQLSMALYGYLHNISFAGQPAVENYKARARTLRTQSDPLQSIVTGDDVLTLAGINTRVSPATEFARSLQQFLAARDRPTSTGNFPCLDYLDVTINGELPANQVKVITTSANRIANTLLGVPVKLRHAPAAYHSTEQSEMDGPPHFVSLRFLARGHEEILLGAYSDSFLRAQAVSTWQTMVEQGRNCRLLIINGSGDEAVAALEEFFAEVAEYLDKG